ncbi:5-formyltetrahydrofolate cyclo-ligase [Sphingomicrobium clamense]|uniref:5-formyltetrahydrofolate cyclo-ligase n=1 Tax=Sphingomicrobium clamense TaxID=2851013 RepID=A0ABS6V5R0_9SPHN|nr:5-formyltetrahydrofolate cyclo-ligase [Sphingomicrobium sp. B8]MBW0144895.1 5-formyltetrahydrofolate cyclo-ligase [Sphingomicrobium sp. B8]
MAVPSPHPIKAKLRKEARAARMRFVSRLEDETRHALEENLAELLAPVLASARIIGTYSPIGSELSPARAIVRARRLGKTIAYPAFEEGDEMFRFRAGEPSMPGPHRIMQPTTDAPVVTPDLILVPLVACGNGGTRLGQGKGHYDRVLAAQKEAGARLIGLGWKVQRLDTDIPAEDWDVPLHAFACPRYLEEF